jgi:uncharacterized protein with HEPN domain
LKERESRDYLHDILIAVNDAESFVGGMTFEQFEKDRKTVNAVVRSLEIIGEASRNVTVDIREKHGEVPWKKMIRMRDKVIHG